MHRDGRMLYDCGSWGGVPVERVNLVRARGFVLGESLGHGSAVTCEWPLNEGVKLTPRLADDIIIVVLECEYC